MADEKTPDVSLIQDEDMLRKMWQETEDFGRKKEIRAHMYKLREARLRDFYNSGEECKDILRSNSSPGFKDKNADNSSHADSLADHSFMSLKSKEIRDSASPTRDAYKIAGKDNDWKVVTSEEESSDGKMRVFHQAASKSGTEKLDGATKKYAVEKEVLSKSYADGDENNFVRSSGHTSKNVVNENIVDESGNNQVRSSTSKSTSSYTEYRSSTDDGVAANNLKYIEDRPGKQDLIDENTKVIRETKTLPDGTIVTTNRYVTNSGSKYESQTGGTVTVSSSNKVAENRRSSECYKSNIEDSKHFIEDKTDSGRNISDVTNRTPEGTTRVIKETKTLPDGTTVTSTRYITTNSDNYETKIGGSVSTTENRSSNVSATKNTTERRTVDKSDTIRNVQTTDLDTISDVTTKSPEGTTRVIKETKTLPDGTTVTSTKYITTSSDHYETKTGDSVSMKESRSSKISDTQKLHSKDTKNVTERRSVDKSSNVRDVLTTDSDTISDVTTKNPDGATRVIKETKTLPDGTIVTSTKTVTTSNDNYENKTGGSVSVTENKSSRVSESYRTNLLDNKRITNSRDVQTTDLDSNISDVTKQTPDGTTRVIKETKTLPDGTTVTSTKYITTNSDTYETKTGGSVSVTENKNAKTSCNVSDSKIDTAKIRDVQTTDLDQFSDVTRKTPDGTTRVIKETKTLPDGTTVTSTKTITTSSDTFETKTAAPPQNITEKNQINDMKNYSDTVRIHKIQQADTTDKKVVDNKTCVRKTLSENIEHEIDNLRKTRKPEGDENTSYKPDNRREPQDSNIKNKKPVELAYVKPAGDYDTTYNSEFTNKRISVDVSPTHNAFASSLRAVSPEDLKSTRNSTTSIRSSPRSSPERKKFDKTPSLYTKIHHTTQITKETTRKSPEKSGFSKSTEVPRDTPKRHTSPIYPSQKSPERTQPKTYDHRPTSPKKDQKPVNSYNDRSPSPKRNLHQESPERYQPPRKGIHGITEYQGSYSPPRNVDRSPSPKKNLHHESPDRYQPSPNTTDITEYQKSYSPSSTNRDRSLSPKKHSPEKSPEISPKRTTPKSCDQKTSPHQKSPQPKTERSPSPKRNLHQESPERNQPSQKGIRGVTEYQRSYSPTKNTDRSPSPKKNLHQESPERYQPSPKATHTVTDYQKPSRSSSPTKSTDTPNETKPKSILNEKPKPTTPKKLDSSPEVTPTRSMSPTSIVSDFEYVKNEVTDLDDNETNKPREETPRKKDTPKEKPNEKVFKRTDTYEERCRQILGIPSPKKPNDSESLIKNEITTENIDRTISRNTVKDIKMDDNVQKPRNDNNYPDKIDDAVVKKYTNEDTCKPNDVKRTRPSEVYATTKKETEVVSSVTKTNKTFDDKPKKVTDIASNKLQDTPKEESPNKEYTETFEDATDVIRTRQDVTRKTTESFDEIKKKPKYPSELKPETEDFEETTNTTDIEKYEDKPKKPTDTFNKKKTVAPEKKSPVRDTTEIQYTNEENITRKTIDKFEDAVKKTKYTFDAPKEPKTPKKPKTEDLDDKPRKLTDSLRKNKKDTPEQAPVKEITDIQYNIEEIEETNIINTTDEVNKSNKYTLDFTRQLQPQDKLPRKPENEEIVTIQGHEEKPRKPTVNTKKNDRPERKSPLKEAVKVQCNTEENRKNVSVTKKTIENFEDVNKKMLHISDATRKPKVDDKTSTKPTNDFEDDKPRKPTDTITKKKKATTSTETTKTVTDTVEYDVEIDDRREDVTEKNVENFDDIIYKVETEQTPKRDTENTDKNRKVQYISHVTEVSKTSPKPKKIIKSKTDTEEFEYIETTLYDQDESEHTDREDTEIETVETLKAKKEVPKTPSETINKTKKAHDVTIKKKTTENFDVAKKTKTTTHVATKPSSKKDIPDKAIPNKHEVQKEIRRTKTNDSLMNQRTVSNVTQRSNSHSIISKTQKANRPSENVPWKKDVPKKEPKENLPKPSLNGFEKVSVKVNNVYTTERSPIPVDEPLFVKKHVTPLCPGDENDIHHKTKNVPNFSTQIHKTVKKDLSHDMLKLKTNEAPKPNNNKNIRNTESSTVILKIKKSDNNKINTAKSPTRKVETISVVVNKKPKEKICRTEKIIDLKQKPKVISTTITLQTKSKTEESKRPRSPEKKVLKQPQIPRERSPVKPSYEEVRRPKSSTTVEKTTKIQRSSSPLKSTTPEVVKEKQPSPTRPNKTRETKCITTKSIIINNQVPAKTEVIVDLQRSKSSREPTPDRLCPLPVTTDEEPSVPRYPDKVSEPDDINVRREIKKFNIINENEEHFVIEECRDQPKYKQTKISDIDKVQETDECLLSVNEKVNKFLTTAENLTKTTIDHNKSFKTEIEQTGSSVADKLNAFIINAQKVTKKNDEIDDDFDQVCEYRPRRQSEKFKESLNVIEKLSQDSFMTSPKRRSSSKTPERESPERVSLGLITTPETPKSSRIDVDKKLRSTETIKKAKALFESFEDKEKRRQRDILSRPSVFEKKLEQKEQTTEKVVPLKSTHLVLDKEKSMSPERKLRASPDFDHKTKDVKDVTSTRLFINREKSTSPERKMRETPVSDHRNSLTSKKVELKSTRLVLDRERSKSPERRSRESTPDYHGIPSYMRPLDRSLRPNSPHRDSFGTRKSPENAPEAPETTRKFGVHLRPTATLVEKKPKSLSPEKTTVDIDQIDDIVVLERMLTETSNYEIRRLIRMRIRLLKQNVEKVTEKVHHRKSPSPENKPTQKTVKTTEVIREKSSEREIRKKSPSPEDKYYRRSSKTTTEITENNVDKISKRFTPSPETKRNEMKLTTVLKELKKTSPVVKKTTTEEQPEWITKSLKKATERKDVVGKFASTTTKTKVSEVTKKESSHEDVITSSYGVGPTDENGTPLFGLKALRTGRKNKNEEIQVSCNVQSSDRPSYTETKMQTRRIEQKTKSSEGNVSISTIINTSKDKIKMGKERTPSLTDENGIKITRRNSVKALSQKFIDNAVDTSKNQASYPKAGLILRTSSFKDSEEKRFHQDKSATVTEKVSSKVGGTFLSNKSKVTGIQDVITRMKNTEEVEVGERVEDVEAKALLNKFLGAQVILSGIEESRVVKDASFSTSTSSGGSSQKSRTTKITMTITKNGKPTTVTRIFQHPIKEEDLEDIWDEQTLRLLLQQSTEYEERRFIRARLLQIMTEQEACADLVEKASQDQTSGSLEGESLLLPLLQGLLDAPENEQTHDSGTESGEDLRGGLINEVQNALDKLSASLLNDSTEISQERRDSLLQLVQKLQVGLSTSKTPTTGAGQGNQESHSRFNKRRQRQNRHTVGVSSEELADARRLMEEISFHENDNSKLDKNSKVLQKQQSESGLDQQQSSFGPIKLNNVNTQVKNTMPKPYGSSTTSTTQSTTSSTLDTPIDPSDSLQFLFNEDQMNPGLFQQSLHFKMTEKVEIEPDDFKSHEEVQKFDHDTDDESSTVKGVKKIDFDDSPKEDFSIKDRFLLDSCVGINNESSKNNRFNKKLRMKRANTVDIPRPQNYYNQESDSSPEQDENQRRRSTYLALRGPIRVGRQTETNKVPSFEPKTESDKKFMAFINKHNENNVNKTSLWTGGKNTGIWNNNFGNIKHNFEAVANNKAVPDNSARNFWKTAEKTKFSNSFPGEKKSAVSSLQRAFEQKSLEPQNKLPWSSQGKAEKFEANKNKFIPQPLPVNKFSHAPASAFKPPPKKVLNAPVQKAFVQQVNKNEPNHGPLYLYSPKPLSAEASQSPSPHSNAMPWNSSHGESRVLNLVAKKFEDNQNKKSNITNDINKFQPNNKTTKSVNENRSNSVRKLSDQYETFGGKINNDNFISYSVVKNPEKAFVTNANNHHERYEQNFIPEKFDQYISRKPPENYYYNQQDNKKEIVQPNIVVYNNVSLNYPNPYSHYQHMNERFSNDFIEKPDAQQRYYPNNVDNHSYEKPTSFIDEKHIPAAVEKESRPKYDSQVSQESVKEYDAVATRVMSSPVAQQATTVRQKSPMTRNEHDMEAAFSLKNALTKAGQEKRTNTKSPEKPQIKTTEPSPQVCLNNKPLSLESLEINDQGETVVVSKFQIPVVHQEKPKVPSPSTILKSDSWHQICNQIPPHKPSPRASPITRKVIKSKSSHTLALPKQFEAGMTKEEMQQKKRTMEAFFTNGNKSPQPEPIVKTQKKSSINRLKTSEKLSVTSNNLSRSRTLPDIVCPPLLDESKIDEEFENLFKSS